MNHTITAIIPVRAGSTRLTNKNIRPFGDANLLIHKIRQLKATPEVTTILVSSDSDEMLEMGKAEGTLTQKRPPEYCDEKTKSFGEVVGYVAENAVGDSIMWAPCVCPLVGAELFSKAIHKYKDVVIQKGEYDSLMSAVQFKEYLWSETAPVNYKLGLGHVPSQQLPEWQVIINGYYLARRQDMVKWSYFFGLKPYRMVVPRLYATDIDDQADYEVAKALLKYLESAEKRE